MRSGPGLNVEANRMVFWVIWASILGGVFVFQIFIGGGIPSGPDAEGTPVHFVGVAVALLLASLAIRILVIPKLKTPEGLLPAMIIGIGVAEGAVFVSLFLIGNDFPTSQLFLLAGTVAVILLHAPIYLGKLQPKRSPGGWEKKD